MENEVLKDIITYATKKLNEAYGYCGLMESGDFAMLNSDDRNGNDIEIVIKTKKD